nr:putative ribonuclease h protein [Quercus suber]
MDSLNCSLLADLRTHVLSPYLIIPAENIRIDRMDRISRSTQPSSAAVRSPVVGIALPLLTEAQPEMECEEIREEFIAESFSNLNSHAGSEELLGAVNTDSIPNLVGSTLQPSPISPIFQHQLTDSEIFSAKLTEIDKEISKYDPPTNTEISVPNQCGTKILPSPESLNTTKYHSPLPHLSSRDHKTSTKPDDHLLSRDPKKSIKPDEHLLSCDPINPINPDDFNPTLTEVPILVISDDVLPQPGTWKRFQNSSRSLASPQAQKIRSIPICFTPQEDILIWPKSKDGMYSVKSGYQLLCAMEKSEVASVLDNGEVKNFWSALWRLNVPNKVKSFAWRACSDCLPTLNNLARRKIVQSNVCLSCWRYRTKKELNSLSHTVGLSGIVETS